MLNNFENKTENFGKKGEMLRRLYTLLSDENNVYIPETLVLSLEFFNNRIKEKLLQGEKKVLLFTAKLEIFSSFLL